MALARFVLKNFTVASFQFEKPVDKNTIYMLHGVCAGLQEEGGRIRFIGDLTMTYMHQTVYTFFIIELI